MLHGKALCESPGAPAFPQQTYQGTSSEWRFPWAKREVHTHQTSRGQGCWASSEPRGCRGQGREPGRGEGDTNSKMNGLNFLCFMEANKKRRRGGEKGDLSTCTRSHAHTDQPRPQSPLVAGVARQPAPTWLAWLWASCFSGPASPENTSRSVTGCCLALIPPPVIIILNGSQYN